MPNPHGRSNADVLTPWLNGQDVTRRSSGTWIIDFGFDRPHDAAALYEVPFAHVQTEVLPARATVQNALERERWWLHARPAPDLRRAVKALDRFIATARVAKHRLFVWVRHPVVVDGQLVITARADDTTFGILHSRLHELWSLRMCTWMGVGNDPRYTPTTTFETFPFPAGLTPADTAHQRTEALPGGALIPADLPAAVRPHAEAIANAAARLVALRDAWLNPPEWTERVPEVVPLGLSKSPYPDRIVARAGHEKDLAKRTLTNLYNARPTWLAQAHAALDAAVAGAYGWADWTPALPDDEILRRLLALNLARSGGAGTDAG
ncbi:MAG: adenine methyltransferase [Burkholderiaceae bacterium]|nr:adenine methyltransferase [Burkholderiaceae bacterium]